MSDFISRQKAIEALDFKIVHMTGVSNDEKNITNPFAQYNKGLEDGIKAIRGLPSAEIEQKIIYCKDCKFAHLTTKGEVKYCDVWFPEEKTYLSADDFCPSAEKRGE